MGNRYYDPSGTQTPKTSKKLKEYLNADNITLFANGHLAMELGIESLKLEGEVITTPLLLDQQFRQFCEMD